MLLFKQSQVFSSSIKRQLFILIMRASLIAIFAGLSAISNGASISCGDPLSTGTLWYRNATSISYEGQIGVLKAYGNAELLAKYPNSNVQAHTIQVLPCNSTYLNATASSEKDIPVKLQLADDTINCLALESNGAANVFVTKQTCQDGDDDSQTAQFWTQDAEYGLLFPTWASESAERWNLQFNQYDTEEVIANPPECFEDQTCQDGEHYSFVIKESS
jgi:hypothetical protein